MDKRELENILDDLKIKVNTKGYRYWITAVEKRLNNKDISMGNLYREIAKVHNSTWSKVERALRDTYMYNVNIIQKYFAIDYDINNSILLELIVREIERRS